MKTKAIFSAICAILFGVSLFREVFVFQSGDSSFLMGLICLLFGWSKVQWLANPLVVASHILLFRGRHRLSVLSSVIAVALALSTLGMREVPKDESGAITPILGFSLGYYLWLSVMVITLAEAIALSLVSKRNSFRFEVRQK
jgi:hypothetical protein